MTFLVGLIRDITILPGGGVEIESWLDKELGKEDVLNPNKDSNINPCRQSN
jgi:hypothetical protein